MAETLLHGVSKSTFDPDANLLQIRGWFLPRTAYDTLQVARADGTLLGTAQCGLARPDLLAKFPEYGEPNGGWYFEGSVDHFSAGEKLILHFLNADTIVRSIETAPKSTSAPPVEAPASVTPVAPKGYQTMAQDPFFRLLLGAHEAEGEKALAARLDARARRALKHLGIVTETAPAGDDPFLDRVFESQDPFSEGDLAAIEADDRLLIALVRTRDPRLAAALAGKYRLLPSIVLYLLEMDYSVFERLLRGKTVSSRAETYAERSITRLATHLKNDHVLKGMAHDFGVPLRAFFDVGCLFGLSFIPAADLGFGLVDGCEIDSNIYVHSREIMRRLQHERPDIQFHYFESDFCALPLNPNTYTLIVLNNVLEHTPDLRETFAKIAEILAEDGLCYIFQGNGASLQLLRTEPHYRLPALTVLPKDLTISILQRLHRIADPTRYVVRQWPGYDELIDAAHSVHLDIEIHPRSLGYWSPDEPLTLHQAKFYAGKIEEEAEQQVFPVLSGEERDDVRRRLQAHCSLVLEAIQGGNKEDLLRYAKCTWDITLRKPPASG